MLHRSIAASQHRPVVCLLPSASSVRISFVSSSVSPFQSTPAPHRTAAVVTSRERATQVAPRRRDVRAVPSHPIPTPASIGRSQPRARCRPACCVFDLDPEFFLWPLGSRREPRHLPAGLPRFLAATKHQGACLPVWTAELVASLIHWSSSTARTHSTPALSLFASEHLAATSPLPRSPCL